jgi:hypothetical protein
VEALHAAGAAGRFYAKARALDNPLGRGIRAALDRSDHGYASSLIEPFPPARFDRGHWPSKSAGTTAARWTGMPNRTAPGFFFVTVAVGLGTLPGCASENHSDDAASHHSLADTSPPPTTSASSTFKPTYDAYVASGYPDAAHGNETTLKVGNLATNAQRTYLMFTVSGFPEGIANSVVANLRLYSQTSATGTIRAHCGNWDGSSNTWNSSTLTWNDQPSYAGVVSSVTSVGAGAWTTFDVSDCVIGNGTYTFVLDQDDGTNEVFNSSRSPSNTPALDVGYTAGSALIGAAVSQADGFDGLVGFDRACPEFASLGPSLQAINCEEAAISRHIGGSANYHYGVHRVYNTWGDPIPTAQFQDDVTNDRLTVWDVHVDCTQQPITWQMIATAGPNSTGARKQIYDQMVSMGQQVASWQTTTEKNNPNSKWKSEQYFTFEHEADFASTSKGCGSATDWAAAYQNLVTIWTAQGVSSKLHHGMILIGGQSTDQWTTFWDSTNPWIASTLTWAGADPYNWYGPACGMPNQPWHTFQEASATFYDWAEHPTEFHHRKIQILITETGTREGPGADAGAPAETKPQWLSDMSSFIQTSWPDLYALSYFDEGGCITPMFINTSQASWSTWMTVATSPYFQH